MENNNIYNKNKIISKLCHSPLTFQKKKILVENKNQSMKNNYNYNKIKIMSNLSPNRQSLLKSYNSQMIMKLINFYKILFKKLKNLMIKYQNQTNLISKK